MVGSMSTLGIGSDGALSYDVIDQLKEADESSIIKPIENKIELNNLKQEKLTELTSMVSALNTEVVAMSDPALYNKKESDLTGDSVSITTSSSAAEMNFSLDVKQLATSDIKQSSTSYAYDGALMGEGSMTLSIGGKDYTINVTSTDSIKDVAKKINENTNGKIEASILNIGGDNPYKLVIKSAETGSANAVSVSGDYNFDQVGNGAKDAIVNYNGVDITRSSNKFDDLIEGVEIKLEKEGVTNVAIKPDYSALKEGMNKFIEKYNEMVKGFADSMRFDQETHDIGLFQGNSSVRLAINSIKDSLVLTHSKDGKSMSDFGLEIQRDGTISFDETKLDEQLKKDPKSVENFFRGTDGRDGAFNRLESTIFDIKTSSNGPLKSLNQDLKDNATRLEEQQKAAQKRLDNRYEIMARQFASYDRMIAQLNSQGDTITALINEQYAQQ